NFNSTIAPQSAFSKSAPIRPKAFVRDDAANTVIEPLTGQAVAPAAFPLAHAARRIAIPAGAAANLAGTDTALPSREFDDHVGRLHQPDGPHARREAHLLRRLAR